MIARIYEYVLTHIIVRKKNKKCAYLKQRRNIIKMLSTEY